IDVDTSTLVDLSQATLDAQQRVNYERAADLTKFIRDREPEGVTVSVGAEIGEVGGKNSDVHELKAFMDGYVRALARLGPYTAINFQHIVFDHPKLPAELRRDIQEWVKAECKDEWKQGDTEEQFYYKSRKKAIGPFKRRMWDLPADVRDAIAADLEKTFAFLFEQLRVTETRAVTDRYVKPPLQSHTQPRPVAVAAPDDLEAGE